jgi:DNA invertase Pin-like site-specific DNA recombinase
MTCPIAVAQYVRMSSEHQRYSIENQVAAIGEYARLRGLAVVKTYSDAARTGVVLKHRQGLMELLRDVIDGNREYAAILVYDVSRWGRFQDADESAHYEFLCESAGVPVHYCAEPFENDGTMSSSVLKALKRSMAGEFSRELGVKVYESKRRISELGFSVGGRTPYGFRRQIVSEIKGRPGRILQAGERKNMHSERLSLVHGPLVEVRCIRGIFRRVLKCQMTSQEIVRDLNRRGITLRGKRWSNASVYSVLTNPVYAGCCTWGRTSRRLGGPLEKVHASQWTLKPGAFPSIIKKDQFDKTQRLLSRDTGRQFWTRERVLRVAGRLLREKGKLSYRIFHESPGAPSPTTLQRFGSFPDLCEAAGYQLPKRFVAQSNGVKHTFGLYQELARRFADLASDVSILPSGRRPKLLVDGCIEVALLICRRYHRVKWKPQWVIEASPSQRNNVTLVARLNSANTAFEGFFIFPNIDLRGRHRFANDDPWLSRGKLLETIPQFGEIVRSVFNSRNDKGLGSGEVALASSNLAGVHN